MILLPVKPEILINNNKSYYYLPWKAFQTAQKRRWEYIKNEWQQEKLKIMNALVGPSENWIDIQKLPEQTIINETVGTRSCLNRIVSVVSRNSIAIW